VVTHVSRRQFLAGAAGIAVEVAAVAAGSRAVAATGTPRVPATTVPPFTEHKAMTPLRVPSSSGPLPPFIRSGPADRPRVGLTVDDMFGASGADNVAALLDIAKQKSVRFTFFPTGGALADHLAAGRQGVWRRVVDEGHEIGNHSYTHSNLTKLSDQQIRDELLRTQDELNRVLGFAYPMRMMRPPGGAGGFTNGGDPRIMSVITPLGYSMVMWSIDSNSTAGNAAYTTKVLANAHNGTIVLTHFTTYAVDNYPALIDGLRVRKLEPTNVSGLFSS
jgi:peptidoglycan/xylan/chitin deacetylase (PgdA/CDA1 family)